jgi:carbon monoxide dehydrogenase subunit G
MEIEQSFVVAYPLDDVWASFHDIPGIVACLPGASLTEPPDSHALKLAMTVKLGPIVASFAGDGEMTLNENEKCGSVSGGGVDRKSATRVKGVAAFSLHAVAANETRVDVRVDYTIAGSLAQFSRGGIVKELATRLTEAFAQNLKSKLDAQSASWASVPDVAAAQVNVDAVAESPLSGDTQASIAQTPDGTASAAPVATQQSTSAKVDTPNKTASISPPPTAAHTTPPANAPLDLGNLFWKMLWSRIRGWLRLGVSSR